MRQAVRTISPPDTQARGRWRIIEEARHILTLHGVALPRRLTAVLSLPYADLPPAPRGRGARVAITIVTVMALAFTGIFTAYTWAQFDAYLSNAEDLGIMDQALWNTLHGALLHQTICNPISDTNCLGDVSRFAIHFEPLMLPLALLYVVVASPKVLLFVQAAVVASGAYPTYWIASRRLSSPLAGICFAAVYLMFPALQGAVLFDFHAVTLAPAFLLFALYCMLTHNNRGLFVAAILAMATKEEVPLDVLMIGLAVLCFQRRWRVGIALVVMACVWLGVAELVMHSVSPTGHSPTAERYTYLGATPADAAVFALTHPLLLVRDQIVGDGGATYLRSLLAPVAYLAVLAPMICILAVPALLINLLSDSASMHSGIHQYSAEIVPFVLFAAISAVMLLKAYAADIEGSVAVVRATRAIAHIRGIWQRDTHHSAAGWLSRSHANVDSRSVPRKPMHAERVVLLVLLLLIMLFSVRQDMRLPNLPWSGGFSLPRVTAHTQIADSMLRSIPATASVSAQDALVPHLSQRRLIYQYPDHADEADYVVLDTDSALIYPFTTAEDYMESVEELLARAQMTIVMQQDGYLLLAHQEDP